jgi:hypothetical protein
MPRVEGGVIYSNAIGVDELCAGQQRAGVNVRIDLVYFHRQSLSVAAQLA